MSYIENRRKKDRRIYKSKFDFYKRLLNSSDRRKENKEQNKELERDTQVWLVCVGLSISLLSAMLLISYYKG
ncbi:MAG TPA: hypothetical protein DCL21_01745 [Alphaproteobacteria bacterium]|nr:hypothetical protein [Alphaproteobacteria bacterium]